MAHRWLAFQRRHFGDTVGSLNIPRHAKAGVLKSKTLSVPNFHLCIPFPHKKLFWRALGRQGHGMTLRINRTRMYRWRQRQIWSINNNLSALLIFHAVIGQNSWCVTYGRDVRASKFTSITFGFPIIIWWNKFSFVMRKLESLFTISYL